MKDIKPLVSVKTITYNHAPYIKKCIDSILMQKTNFKFELVIGEDFSTDGTRDICKRYAEQYPEIIKLIISETNVGAKVNSKRTFEECQGKYIAFCEGDDYWTDPDKLQKQVDFLEDNSDYGLVHTGYNRYNNTQHRFITNSNSYIPVGSIFENLLRNGNCIATLTVLVRRELLDNAQNLVSKVSVINKWKMGDFPLWIEISRSSEIGYIKEITSVYRLLSNSASHSPDVKRNSEFIKSIMEIRRWFCIKYNKHQFLPIIDEDERYRLYSNAIINGFEDIKKYRAEVRKYKLKNRSFRNIIMKFMSINSIVEGIIAVLIRVIYKDRLL